MTRALNSYYKFSDAIGSKLFELEETSSNMRVRTKSNFLFIRYQLQRMHIEQMSVAILDVQILNGKVFISFLHCDLESFLEKTDSVIGLSLLIGTMVQSRRLNLYHYHIIYDTVSLTGYVSQKSSCPINWDRKKNI